MLKKKHLQSHSFTLVEILAAMSIFLILSLIMMRFFNSAQKIFSVTSQRNILYSDARVAMDLIARELQSTMYNNANTEQGIYPFWFQKIDDAGGIYYNPAIEWTALNFIASTGLKPDLGTDSSNICELRYTFVPAGKTFVNPDNSVIPEGWLIRSCTPDKLSGGATNLKYNFSTNSRLATSPEYRLNRIWVDKTTGTSVENPAVPLALADVSYNNFEKVIPNVYKLNFICYGLDSAGEFAPIPSLKGDFAAGTGFGTLGVVPLPSIFSTANVNGILGTPFPVAIKIELSLLSDPDWFQWTNAIKESNDALAAKIIQQKLRTFSKTVYLPVKETY